MTGTLPDEIRLPPWSPADWDGSWLVVPDLHGHEARLRAALGVARTRCPAARLAFLGDLLDDSPRRREARRALPQPGAADDSRAVLGTVRRLADSGRAEVLLGNHEVMALASVFRDDRALMNVWWKVGGREAAASYGWDGRGDAGELRDDLSWLSASGQLWLEVGPDGGRLLLAHATRPSLERLGAGQNGASDLWPSDAEDPVVWFPLGSEDDPQARRLSPLPAGFSASIHGHMETPELRTLMDTQGQPAYQIDLHPGRPRMCLTHVTSTGETRPLLVPLARG